MAAVATNLTLFMNDTPMDGTSTGTAELSSFGANPDHILSPIAMIVETIEADTVSETAVISMGTNSPDYDNIVKAYAVNPVAGTVVSVPLGVAPLIFNNNTAFSLYARVRHAATATDLTFRASLEALNRLLT